MSGDLARLANDQWRASYRKLIADVDGEWRDFGALHAFVSPLPLHFANGCLVFEHASVADLEAAVGWLTAAQVPYRVRIDIARAPYLLAACSRLALVRDNERMPGMVLRPLPDPPFPPPAVTVERLTQATYPEYIELMIAAGTPERWAAASFPREFIDDPDMAAFIGRLEGRPVGTSLVLRTGHLAGIFAVGTAEAARRRGVGRAVTWAAVAAARDWGCSAVALQASEMGYPVYRAMGFEPVVEYARFMPAEAPGSPNDGYATQ